MSSSHPDAASIRPSQEGARLAQQLDGWLARTDALLRAVNATDVAQTVNGIAERHHAPGFRVAVVGEFNRGKSTLVNRLLGRPNLIPVGDVPTTALMTSVVPGSPERMEMTTRDGSTERRPVTPASWSDLLAEQLLPQGGPDDITDVRLVIENAWLHELNAELVDTPGAGDLAPERIEALYDVLARTDAAVFVVSALLPFSLTERDFLENQVLGRHIARVVVVVSQLDKVAEDERESVMRVVRNRVSHVAPNVDIVSSYPLSASASDAAPLEEVRARVEGLAQTSDRVLWRSRQLSEQLIDCLDTLADVGQTAIRAATWSADQRAEAVRARRDAARRADAQWDQISTQLDQRALHLERIMRQRIQEESGQLLRLLDADMSKAPDPGGWWERDYPRLLSRELVRIGQQSERALLDRVNEDIEWLADTVSDEMDRPLALARLRAAGTPEPALPNASRRPRLRDWGQTRLLARLGLGAAALVLFFFVAPISIVATVGAGMVSEKLIDAQERQQREIIRQHLAAVVSEAIDNYAAAVAARVRQVYREVSDQLRKEQEELGRSAETMLESGSTADKREAWQQAIADAAALRNDIITALAQ